MRVTKHHKSPYARFMSLSLSVVLCLTLLAGNAWTQSGAHEWGYERDSGSRARMDEAIRLTDQVTPVPLAPHSSTDFVLRSFALGTENGYRVVNIEGQNGGDIQDFFWMVDTRTNTYRTMNMTWDVNADAQRLHGAIAAELPQDGPSLSRLQQEIAKVYSIKLGVTADLDEMDEEERQNSASYPECLGRATTTIVTYDPPKYMLTYTTSWARWYYPGDGSYISVGGGECWANPNTPIGTSWFVDSCRGSSFVNSYRSRYTTWNRSYNYDFGDDDVATWVLQKAEVRHDNGWARWSTSHRDWGEFSWLIYGYELIGYANC